MRNDWSASRLSLVALVVLQVGVVRSIRASRIDFDRDTSTVYLASTAVFLTEILKLAINLLLERQQLARKNQERTWPNKRVDLCSGLLSNDGLKLAIVPALFYVVQNTFEYIALTHLTVPLYQITNQGKLLTMVLFRRILPRQHQLLSPNQYLALFLLALGVALQLYSMLGREQVPQQDYTQSRVVGFLAMCVACIASGFGRVYFERLLAEPLVSVYIRNSQVALWSIPFAMMGILSDLDKIKHVGLFQGYSNALVWTVILSQAVYGLVVSLATKHAVSGLHGFGVSIYIVFAAMCTTVIWGVSHWNAWNVWVGAVLILYSVRLFYKHPAAAELSADEEKGHPYRSTAKVPGKRHRHALLLLVFALLFVQLLIQTMRLSKDTASVRARIDQERRNQRWRGRVLKHPFWEPPTLMLGNRTLQKSQGIRPATTCSYRSIPADTEWSHPGYTGYSSCMWYHCSRDVEQCDNTLSTTFDGPDPPCCSHLMRDMAAAVDEVMCSLGLVYMVEWGSLLGLVRSDRFIPWTGDHDITMTRSTMAALWALRNEGTLSKHGLAMVSDSNFRFCISPTFAKGKLQRWEMKRPWSSYVTEPEQWWLTENFLYTDVGWTGLTEDDLYFGPGAVRFLPEDVYPLLRRPVYNGTFYVNFPHNSEAMLSIGYGPDWGTPDARQKKHGDPAYLKHANRSVLVDIQRGGQLPS